MKKQYKIFLILTISLIIIAIAHKAEINLTRKQIALLGIAVGIIISAVIDIIWAKTTNRLIQKD